MKVGLPIMKLDNLDHFKYKSKHIGNAKAITCEALSERHSPDEDLDPSKTKDNIYIGGFTSGEKLVDFWTQMASKYRVNCKDGKKKRLRKDAGIGFAGIVKPNIDEFKNFDTDTKVKFLRESLTILENFFKEKGGIIDCAVIHLDEKEVHMHYFGHDPEYKVRDKFTSLPFYKTLNTEYPKQMEQLGYDVEVLKGYQEDIEGMNEDEIREYKIKHMAENKHGRSSREYKADKRLEELDRQIAKRERLLAELDAKVKAAGLEIDDE